MLARKRIAPFAPRWHPVREYIKKPDCVQRLRRYYRLTAGGRRILRQQRSVWRDFVAAMNPVTGGEHA